MSEYVEARGSIGTIGEGGRATPEYTTVVLTSTRAQIDSGERWADGRYREVIAFGNGSAFVYARNPVYVWATGSIAIGEAGVATITQQPRPVFKDFAIWPHSATYKGLDPVEEGIIESDNQGVLTPGPGGDWIQVKRIFYPPKSARYIVPVARFENTPVNAVQYVDAVQMEALAASDTTVSVDYRAARSIRPRVRPTRLNLSEQPSRSPVTTTATHTQTVQMLTPGETYVFSARVTGTGVELATGGTQLESGYDEDLGRYWVRFRAKNRSHDVEIAATGTFTYSRILVEETDTVRPYFDGSSGDDYLWEFGKTKGVCRSYFYEDRVKRHYLLMRVLRENVPLGITVESPLYADGGVFVNRYGDGRYGDGQYEG